MTSANGTKNYLYPKRVYCYRSIKYSLEEMLLRPGFKDILHHGPNKSDHLLADVCDGEIFRNFQDDLGNNYFADKRNLAIMLNVDWFNPFKNTEYSLGAIYAVFLNIPRELRFKWENVLLLGIFPGPTEPKFHINAYLQLIADELLLFWNGQALSEGGKSVFYKIALLCISSDIPAMRKCCGFMAHNALKCIFLYILLIFFPLELRNVWKFLVLNFLKFFI